MAVRKAIEQCSLESLADRPFHAISGGERQKTLIAAAIAQDAAVMFLDEPNTALDPAYQTELVRILREWHAAGRGIVLVSHDLQLPAALGGRVVALNGGQIAADGPVNEVLTSTRLEAVYGAPFAEARLGNGTTIVLPQWWQG